MSVDLLDCTTLKLAVAREADLALAIRHVREGREHIDLAVARIAKSRKRWQATAQTEHVFDTMRTTLQLMLDHEKAIRLSMAIVKGA